MAPLQSAGVAWLRGALGAKAECVGAARRRIHGPGFSMGLRRAAQASPDRVSIRRSPIPPGLGHNGARGLPFRANLCPSLAFAGLDIDERLYL